MKSSETSAEVAQVAAGRDAGVLFEEVAEAGPRQVRARGELVDADEVAVAALHLGEGPGDAGVGVHARSYYTPFAKHA